jgi:hypothetical protein
VIHELPFKKKYNFCIGQYLIIELYFCLFIFILFFFGIRKRWMDEGRNGNGEGGMEKELEDLAEKL